MPQHATLTGSNLHEPKGVASANSDEVYVADGAGSGAWTDETDWRLVPVYAELDDVSSNASTYVVCPVAGTVEKVWSVLHAAISNADATLTTKINGTNITDGSLTITQGSSAAGDVDVATPSAANTITAGDYLEVESDGGSTNAVRMTITFLVRVA